MSADEVAVGDWLLLSAEDHRATMRLDRQTLLYRQAVSAPNSNSDDSRKLARDSDLAA
ncbi:hypothetical protein NG895_00760 [Aeoliella sp. ICT_H6.2]|uniref:Uncharacterized protein n=1 Tax=Aeoliella straminimaris TaxID=2954799 RepID=A0A9X2F575_9BACT|nr:hypothetical protein [Aeoliella straminimaris]MCO6042425.1 hypothetical protein [Aeoliella straminimaris]